MSNVISLHKANRRALHDEWHSVGDMIRVRREWEASGSSTIVWARIKGLDEVGCLQVEDPESGYVFSVVMQQFGDVLAWVPL